MRRGRCLRIPRRYREIVTAPVRKPDCPGCVALVDDLGRFTPGFCGPDCAVRADRDRRLGLA